MLVYITRGCLLVYVIYDGLSGSRKASTFFLMNGAYVNAFSQPLLDTMNSVNGIEACGVFVDGGGVAFVGILASLGWGDGGQYVNDDSRWPEEKLYACLDAYEGA